jgi:hypothetical protein
LRFKTKFDWWIVAALVLAAFVTLVLPWIRSQSVPGPYHHPAPFWVKSVVWLIWVAVLVCTLPQYYDVRADGLFIRQGWRRVLIPYADLVELQATTDSRSAGVFSMDRMVVVTRDSRTFIIAPADQEGFLEAVSLRCPQLERKGFGLALPFSPTAIS